MLVAWVPAERPRPGVAGPVVASWMRQNGSDGASNHPGPGSDARYARVPRNARAVKTLFEYLEGGDTLEDFLEGFPTVSRELAIQALEEAKHLLLSRV